MKVKLKPHLGTPMSKKMIGRKYGRLTIVSVAGVAYRWKIYLNAVCDCGNMVIAVDYSIRRGSTNSCGCYRNQRISESTKIHGESGWNSPRNKIYTTWASIKQRCFDEKADSYILYGGRGITICDRYNKNYEEFKKDIGERPTNEHSVDRINPNGHYSCGKCKQCKSNKWPMNIRWADRETQNYNRRNTYYLTINGDKINILQASRIYGVKPKTIKYRISAGWSSDDAIKNYSHRIHKIV